jgi:SNF2 family DNA or RNA helicase|tara:strand:- start:84 stop:1553 length:1470 start_codon:yes stop_codon:yes gene_type:complete
MSTKYKFKTKPFEHQLKVFKESWDKSYYALFMEMGTGKSKVAIDSMGALYLEGKIAAAIIIAPKGVYDNWVEGEIPQHLPDEIQRIVLRWEPSKSKKFYRDLDKVKNVLNTELKILVINTEAFSSKKGAKAAVDFLMSIKDSGQKVMTIVDESTTIKNKNAIRSKTIMAFGDKRYSDYRRILTGSPITKSPIDLFSQCEFLNDKCLGYNNFYTFRAQYAIIQKRTMGHHSFQEIVGYRNLEELNEKLQLFSSRVLKEDCLDLPSKTYVTRDVAMSEQQINLYTQMQQLALAQYDNGELATTASVLTQLMRLQQICCGFLKTDDDEIQDLKNSRLEELMNLLSEISGKVIIWATFTHNIHRIVKEIQKVYGDASVAAYFGETPQEERQKIVSTFQDKGSELRFFVGQPRTGGYGITLHAATTVIYYSNSFDLEIRLQSEDRAHRIGQENKVTYIDLVSPKTVDEKIIKALGKKSELAGKVLGENPRDWLV